MTVPTVIAVWGPPTSGKSTVVNAFVRFRPDLRIRITYSWEQCLAEMQKYGDVTDLFFFETVLDPRMREPNPVREKLMTNGSNASLIEWTKEMDFTHFARLVEAQLSRAQQA